MNTNNISSEPEITQNDNSLERYIVKRDSVQSDLENNCAVCLESLNNNDCVGELKCKHHFHYDCIKKWVHISANCKNDIKNTAVITNSNQNRRNPRRSNRTNPRNNQNIRNQRRRTRRVASQF